MSEYLYSYTVVIPIKSTKNKDVYTYIHDMHVNILEYHALGNDLWVVGVIYIVYNHWYTGFGLSGFFKEYSNATI